MRGAIGTRVVHLFVKRLAASATAKEYAPLGRAWDLMLPTEMTCREFIEFLSAYRDGDLQIDQRANFDRHLADCDECVKYLRDYEATIRAGKMAFKDPDAPVPDEVPDELVRAILTARRR
ncbi:MAG: anti-sigma factor family protein [Candidatus Binataceae bacterium]